MLVLTRKNRESVVVGGAGDLVSLLKITVLEIKGSKVRLGFEVDGSVTIQRLEIWERLRDGKMNGHSDGECRTIDNCAMPVV